MLLVTIPEREFFDESEQEFVKIKGASLTLEHSLVSLSKWESKWCKPFMRKDDKPIEETVDYIRCMTITQHVKNEVYEFIPDNVIDQVMEYINAPMTATWFNENKNSQKNRDVITAEIIYYWMISLNIPMECEKWHLNRLITLIRVCSLKNQPQKKMSKKEMLANRRALNNARRSKSNHGG